VRHIDIDEHQRISPIKILIGPPGGSSEARQKSGAMRDAALKTAG
jgi:hypothetical protein